GEPAELDPHVAPSADLEAARRRHEIEAGDVQRHTVHLHPRAVEAPADVRVVERADEALGDARLPQPLEARVLRHRLLAVEVAEPSAEEAEAPARARRLRLHPALAEPPLLLQARVGVLAIRAADADGVLRDPVEYGVLVLERRGEPAPFRGDAEL